MAENVASVTIHEVNLEVDLGKLSAASMMNVVRTALIRRLSLGAKTKTKDELTALAAALKENPNSFFEVTRGEGVSRPKMSPIEKEAASWFSDKFLLALKTPSVGAPHESAKKSWGRYGGKLVDEAGKAAVILKAGKEDSAERKAVLDANLAAKVAVIAAKIKKMQADGWEFKLD